MVLGESPEPAIRAVDERARRCTSWRTSPRRSSGSSTGSRSTSPATPQRVTQGAGWHSVTMSKDARVFVDTFSNADHAAQRHAAQRSAARRLRDAGQRADARIRTRPMLAEHVRAGVRHARRGRRPDAALQLLKPRNLEPGKRYPVLVDVYGGPGVQRVTQLRGATCSTSISRSTATSCSRSTIAAAVCAACSSRRRSIGRAWAASKSRTR